MSNNTKISFKMGNYSNLPLPQGTIEPGALYLAKDTTKGYLYYGEDQDTLMPISTKLSQQVGSNNNPVYVDSSGEIVSSNIKISYGKSNEEFPTEDLIVGQIHFQIID